MWKLFHFSETGGATTQHHNNTKVTLKIYACLKLLQNGTIGNLYRGKFIWQLKLENLVFIVRGIAIIKCMNMQNSMW